MDRSRQLLGGRLNAPGSGETQPSLYSFDVLHRGLDLFDDRWWHRDIAQWLRISLTVGQAVVEEINQDVQLFLVVFFVAEEPGIRDNRIGILSLRIGCPHN